MISALSLALWMRFVAQSGCLRIVRVPHRVDPMTHKLRYYYYKCPWWKP